LKGEPKVAELAVTVVGSHQGRGPGGLLAAMLRRSAARPRENGIETFLGYVLSENPPIVRIARHWGARVNRDKAGFLKTGAPAPAPRDVALPTARRAFQPRPPPPQSGGRLSAQGRACSSALPISSTPKSS